MPAARPVLALVVLSLAAAPAAGAGGAVATEHPRAAAAGAAMLRAGGNAVDAALAAAATVCVVHPASCGLGGGGFALVREATGRAAALDYREQAPAAATPDRFFTDGRPDPALLRRGGLAVGVPGEVAGLTALHRRFGRLPLARVLAPAIALAREGFTLAETPHLHRQIERAAATLAADPGLRAVFLGPDGSVPGPDFRVVQVDLAGTLEAVAAGGAAAFYRGPLAAAVAAAARERGGVLQESDLAAYRPRWRRPLRATFRGRRILTFPPPGSGGVVLEILGLLARDDLAALGAETATTLHLLAAAMIQAFADRARWYGDPAFAPVPVAALLAPPRLAALRAGFSTLRVPEAHTALRPDAGTAHVSAVDAEGNAVALTTTINTTFGSGILVPGTGIVLNNQMDDFALAPDLPNLFGLTAEAVNAPAPGKRPQSSMSPTIVLGDGRPELVVGGSGGPTIVSGAVQVLLGVVVFGRDLRAAVDAPRIHHQGVPPALVAEAGVAPAVRAALERVGHRVVARPTLGAVAAAGLDPAGAPVAAGDRRKDGGEAVAP
jgi:gamma-glutamyltranspeptidase/glutathione hydrolase